MRTLTITTALCCIFSIFLDSCNNTPTPHPAVNNIEIDGLLERLVGIGLLRTNSEDELLVEIRKSSSIRYYVSKLHHSINSTSILVSESDWSDRVMDSAKQGKNIWLIQISLISESRIHVTINGDAYDVSLYEGTYKHTPDAVD